MIPIILVIGEREGEEEGDEGEDVNEGVGVGEVVEAEVGVVDDKGAEEESEDAHATVTGVNVKVSVGLNRGSGKSLLLQEKGGSPSPWLGPATARKEREAASWAVVALASMAP